MEIRSRARACLSRLDRGEREEALAEVLAGIFKSVVGAARRGTLGRLTPYHLVVFGVRQYRAGRRFAGYSSTDVMAEATRVRGRVDVASLEERRDDGRGKDAPSRGCGAATRLADVLSDRREGDPAERTRVTLDYPEILRREAVGGQARRVFRLLSQVQGRGSVDAIAGELGVTAGRVCHLKSRLARALARHGYVPPATRNPAASVAQPRVDVGTSRGREPPGAECEG